MSTTGITSLNFSSVSSSKSLRCWFYSEHSVSSHWVEKEVETAMELERDINRVVLFPVRLDDSVMGIKSGWPGDIQRTRHIGDFRRWRNPESYQKVIDRLLRDLKAEKAKADR